MFGVIFAIYRFRLTRMTAYATAPRRTSRYAWLTLLESSLPILAIPNRDSFDAGESSPNPSSCVSTESNSRSLRGI